METRELTLSIPLTLTVRIGDALSTTGVPEPSLAPTDEEAARPTKYYDGYRGYDPSFLGEGLDVPLPQLSEEQQRNAAKNSAAGDGDDPTLLPYTHFSIVINRRRQLAYYTAVNIDGNQLVDLHRGEDRWYFDSRIAESEQIGEELYRRNALDRGHLVRRLDPVWGPESERANDDTFHFTNCSPQHEKFNQGKDRWQGLENYILDHADVSNRCVTVFTGPVTSEDDPIYKGIRLPLAYWKIIVYAKDGRLAAAAYLLDQAKLVDEMLSFEAEFDAGMYRISLEELKGLTNLDFAYLQDLELPLSDDGLEAARERVLIQDDYSNLIL